MAIALCVCVFTIIVLLILYKKAADDTLDVYYLAMVAVLNKGEFAKLEAPINSQMDLMKSTGRVKQHYEMYGIILNYAKRQKSNNMTLVQYELARRLNP